MGAPAAQRGDLGGDGLGFILAAVPGEDHIDALARQSESGVPAQPAAGASDKSDLGHGNLRFGVVDGNMAPF